MPCMAFDTMLASPRKPLRLRPPSGRVAPAWKRSLAIITAITDSSVPLIRPARNEQGPGEWIYIPSPTNPTLVATQRPPSMGIHTPSDDMVMGLSTDSALSTTTDIETSPRSRWLIVQQIGNSFHLRAQSGMTVLTTTH